MLLYPLAMHTSELGVFRSMISVEATFEGYRLTCESNQTPVPIPRMKTPASKAFVKSEPKPLLVLSGGGGGGPDGGCLLGCDAGG